MGIEHRKQKRIPFKQQILINNSMMVNSVDISEGGLYVHTGRMFPSGSILDISFQAGRNPLNLKARVQHCQEGIGMGLELVDINPEQEAELKSLLTELEAKTSATGRKRILIVDDNDSVRRMNKSKLVLDGFTVLEARDGIEAIKILQAEPLDLMIIDLYMERMDGFKLITLIRQMPQLKNIPIIVFSARSAAEAVEQAMNVGADLFLVKTTTSPMKLSENVKALLKK